MAIFTSLYLASLCEIRPVTCIVNLRSQQQQMLLFKSLRHSVSSIAIQPWLLSAMPRPSSFYIRYNNVFLTLSLLLSLKGIVALSQSLASSSTCYVYCKQFEVLLSMRKILVFSARGICTFVLVCQCVSQLAKLFHFERFVLHDQAAKSLQTF